LLFVGQANAGLVTGLLEESVGHLDEDARAVAGVIFTSTSTTVTQIQQDRKGILHDGVAFAAFDVDDKPNTTRIVFSLGVK
jgi:hypothetical protein